jgi:large subunit ribosomal protein L10
MATPQKEVSIQEITADFKESDAAVLTEYRGLTVAQLKTLRRALGPETKYAVVKNTLTGLAAKAAGIDAFDGQLTGPTAIAFIKGDQVKAAKGLTDFAKDNDKLIIKAGVFEGQPMDASQIAALAALESREHQLARVAGVLKAPMSTLARTIDALRAKQAEDAPAEA